MNTSEAKSEPGPINSSYLILFHIAVFFVAMFVTTIFPAELRNDSLMVSVVFPIALFWFSYLIKQFFDVTLAMKIILGAAFVVAALSLLNAAYGSLSDGVVPVIYTRVPFFATLFAGLSGPIGLIYAGTLLTYGAYVYLLSLTVASFVEPVYETFGSRLLPRGLRKSLRKVDTRVDTMATQASDKFFVHNQLVGLLVCVTLVAIYALLYIYLLIK